MTSTEFTIGLDGTRVSSKVLKPPGGGSSDIFGLGSSNCAMQNGRQNQSTTQNRLFGVSTEQNAVHVRTPAKANIFEDKATKSIKKRHVHRNPITGEEIEYNTENGQKSEDKEENCNKEINDEKEEKTEVSSKPVQTSIRVRNPPGGKSSGIF